MSQRLIFFRLILQCSKKLLPPDLRAEYDCSLLDRTTCLWLPEKSHGWFHGSHFAIIWRYSYISKANKYFFHLSEEKSIRVRYATSWSPITIVSDYSDCDWRLIIYILTCRPYSSWLFRWNQISELSSGYLPFPYRAFCSISAYLRPHEVAKVLSSFVRFDVVVDPCRRHPDGIISREHCHWETAIIRHGS